MIRHIHGHSTLGLIKNLDIGLALEVEGEAVCSLGVDTTFVGRIRRGVIALIYIE